MNFNNTASAITTETLIAAVNDSRSPLILTDYSLPDNPIVFTNNAFLELTGYGEEDVIGKNCRFLQGNDTDPETINQLRDAVKNGTSVRVDIKNYKKDGTPFWNDLILSPITDATGKITHFMGMQLDITDRKYDEEQILKKSKELQESNYELEQFTYATSHDLQEPLRMINSYLQLLKKRYGDRLDEDALKYLGFATEGADRMQELINDLLILSRVASSEDIFKVVSMSMVLEKVLHNLRVSIDESDAVVTIKSLPEQNVDPVQMAQLFQNLIGNAIKYRKKGVTPHIEVSATKTKKETIYSVSDDGIGIEEKYFERIFGVFQRLHTKNEYKGTGVGLAICTRIVERHNGRIWVESSKDNGSVFKVALPNK